MHKRFATAALVAAVLGIAACDGSAEKTGENLDSSIEEAARGEENLGDGPLERAGESVDEATDNADNDDGADALSDATDGNPNTNP